MQLKSVPGTEAGVGRTDQDDRMEPSAYDSLPRAYRIGLRLHALGADDQLIAECLEVDPASIGTLLEIGSQKLENSIQAPLDPNRSGDEPIS
jgi:hypothetical protein